MHPLEGAKVIPRNVKRSKGQSAWHFLMETYLIPTQHSFTAWLQKTSDQHLHASRAQG